VGRKWLVGTLRRLGYQQAADEALRDLPDQIDLQQLRNSASGTASPATRGSTGWEAARKWVNPSGPASRSWPSSRTGRIAGHLACSPAALRWTRGRGDRRLSIVTVPRRTDGSWLRRSSHNKPPGRGLAAHSQ